MSITRLKKKIDSIQPKQRLAQESQKKHVLLLNSVTMQNLNKLLRNQKLKRQKMQRK